MELPWGLLPVRKAETPQRGVLRFNMEEQGYYQGDPKTLWRLVCGHWWQQECKNTKSVKFPFSLPKEITIVQTMCPVTCLFPPQTRILSKSNRLANNKSAIANQELVNPKLTTFKDAVNLNGGTQSANRANSTVNPYKTTNIPAHNIKEWTEFKDINTFNWTA